ncbi:hypothetical protein BC830DRAFT_1137551 [Chytriomyces sp. MP71]|nr:hypothetical protein BC830DRAFT_1137551 [Chytriomyces sp. MP71]
MVVMALALAAQRLFEIQYPDLAARMYAQTHADADEGKTGGPSSGGGGLGQGAVGSAEATTMVTVPPQPRAHASSLDSILAVLRLLLLRVSLPMLNVKIPSDDPIEYVHIFGSEAITMCLFVLKKGATLPVHSHPNMTVFSRVIHGDLHVKTYALHPGESIHPDSTVVADKSVSTETPKAHPYQPSAHAPHHHHHSDLPYSASLASDVIVSHTAPGSGSILEINQATPNLHTFAAVSDHCVVFDLIFPPYDEDVRPCTYFSLQEAHTTATAPPPSAPRAIPTEGGGKEDTEPGMLLTQMSLMSMTVDKLVAPPFAVHIDASPPPLMHAATPTPTPSALQSATSSPEGTPRAVDDAVAAPLAQRRLEFVELDYTDEIPSVAYAGQAVKPEQLERGALFSDMEVVQLASRVLAMVEKMSQGAGSALSVSTNGTPLVGSPSIRGGKREGK